MIAQGLSTWVALGGACAASGASRSACAQTGADDKSPPWSGAPTMRAGQRVQRPQGWVEVTTFNRSYSQQQQESVFKVEFTYMNEHPQGQALEMRDFARLVADGVPRAPFEWFPGFVSVPPESAQDCSATFKVRGRPRVVHIQFGTGGNAARSYLRWPD